MFTLYHRFSFAYTFFLFCVSFQFFFFQAVFLYVSKKIFFFPLSELKKFVVVWSVQNPPPKVSRLLGILRTQWKGGGLDNSLGLITSIDTLYYSLGIAEFSVLGVK